MPPARRVQVEVEGRTLSLSNLDKVLYPRPGFTKGQVIDYYTRVAPVLLPHLRGHPLTLKRYPTASRASTSTRSSAPPTARTGCGPRRSRPARKTIDFCLCEDLPTLVWMANLADLELHPSLSQGEHIERPTVMAFDLDPGEPAGLAECCEVALILREALERIGLESFPKTSGSKGIQVYVPLNRDEATYDDTSRSRRRWPATWRPSTRS